MTSRYIYLTSMYLFAFVFVFIVFIFGNPNINTVKGISTDNINLLIQRAIEKKSHRELEVFCDLNGNYLVTHEAIKMPSLSSHLMSKLHFINGRAYYFNIKPTDVQDIINLYLKTNAQLKVDYDELVSNCQNY